MLNKQTQSLSTVLFVGRNFPFFFLPFLGKFLLVFLAFGFQIPQRVFSCSLRLVWFPLFYASLAVYGPFVCVCSVAQLCLTHCGPMGCRLSGSSVHGFSRQEYWSGLPFPTPGDLPDSGIEPASIASPALAGGFFTIEVSGEPFFCKFTQILTPVFLECLLSLNSRSRSWGYSSKHRHNFSSPEAYILVR